MLPNFQHFSTLTNQTLQKYLSDQYLKLYVFVFCNFSSKADLPIEHHFNKISQNLPPGGVSKNSCFIRRPPAVIICLDMYIFRLFYCSFVTLCSFKRQKKGLLGDRKLIGVFHFCSTHIHEEVMLVKIFLAWLDFTSSDKCWGCFDGNSHQSFLKRLSNDSYSLLINRTNSSIYHIQLEESLKRAKLLTSSCGVTLAVLPICLSDGILKIHMWHFLSDFKLGNSWSNDSKLNGNMVKGQREINSSFIYSNHSKLWQLGGQFEYRSTLKRHFSSLFHQFMPWCSNFNTLTLRTVLHSDKEIVESYLRCCIGRCLLNKRGRQNMCPTGWVVRIY